MSSIYAANDPAVYEQSMGRWSRRLAGPFLEFAAIGDAAEILDVGCGTGSLAFALADAAPGARITGIDHSQIYVDHARSRAPNDGRLVFEQGDAAALPYGVGAFDAVLSLLVLNFVSDAEGAAGEMARVTRPGGVVAACVWDFRGGLTFLRVLVDTAAALDPDGEAFRAKQFSAPFTGPSELAAAWTNMGLTEVEQVALTIRMEFRSFADYWEPWLGGQGTVGAYVTTLSEAKRRLLEHHLRLAYLAGGEDGPQLGGRHVREERLHGRQPDAPVVEHAPRLEARLALRRGEQHGCTGADQLPDRPHHLGHDRVAEVAGQKHGGHVRSAIETTEGDQALVDPLDRPDQAGAVANELGQGRQVDLELPQGPWIDVRIGLTAVDADGLAAAAADHDQPVVDMAERLDFSEHASRQQALDQTRIRSLQIDPVQPHYWVAVTLPQQRAEQGARGRGNCGADARGSGTRRRHGGSSPGRSASPSP
jgi:SAM-dependent methyltransferase